MDNVIVSEYVSYGHPDKIADQISDAILDACLIGDKNSRTGIEVMVKDNIVVLGGEITTNTQFNYDFIVRNVYKDLNFPKNHGLYPENLKIINLIGKQSTEIHSGVDIDENIIGAGDQGFAVGYASNDTDVYMPLGIYLAKIICNYVSSGKILQGCGPDTKSQIIVDHSNGIIKSILVSTMHTPDISLSELREVISSAIINNTDNFIPKDIYEKYIHKMDKSMIHINPCGTWNIGGPISDCGVTGRKIVVDQYGGYSNVGGGNLHGKDMTKVDRSGAYMARYLAKNIVAAGIAASAKVELSYMIGVPEPSSVNITLTETQSNLTEHIKQWIMKNIDLSPLGIMKRFDYSQPRYQQVAVKGHYGFNNQHSTHPWEDTDIANKIS